MEMENRYASNGKGNLGVTLGAVGLGAALLGGNGLAGILGNGNCGCERNAPVTRYDAEKDARIAALETEVKLRDANTFTLGEMNLMRNYVDEKFAAVNSQLCNQAVVNAQVAANLGCLQNNVSALTAMTKTIIPIDNICPNPMPQYNAWVAPTSGTAG